MSRRAGGTKVEVHHDVGARTIAGVAGVGAAAGAAAVAAALRVRGRPSIGKPEDATRAGDTGGEDAGQLDQRVGAADGATGDTKADAIRQRRDSKLLRRVDDVQRRRTALGFSVAVLKKFGEDSSSGLAALIAYYGFLSLFPLLLALTTVLATVLGGHAALQRRILDSALVQFPVIGDQIRQNIHSLHGSGVALAVGIGGALWGGMGVMKAAGRAMDQLWEVPKRDRPRFVRSLVRAALLLVVLGGGVVVTTVLSGLGTSGTASFLPLRIAGLVAGAAVNVAVFALGFRVLTVRDVAWRDLVPGAIVAGLGWMLLQSVGSYYVTHQLRGASQTYGMFAVVIGLLSWLYLQAQLTLLAAEINVVRAARLWPRSLAGELTPADKRAFASYAEVEERHPQEDVGVGFERDDEVLGFRSSTS